MPLEITKQNAILGWDTQKATLTQSGNGAQTLQLNIQKPLLEMQTTLPKIQIDQSQPFAEAGLKNIKAFMSDAVSYGQQIVSQGIARIVDQGNSFIEIHTGVDPIPDQAVYNAYDMFEKSFNYGAIPQSRPDITLKRGEVNTTLNRGTVQNNSSPQKVEMNYTPWQVSYHLKQYQNISFRYQPSQFKFSV